MPDLLAFSNDGLQYGHPPDHYPGNEPVFYLLHEAAQWPSESAGREAWTMIENHGGWGLGGMRTGAVAADHHV